MTWMILGLEPFESFIKVDSRHKECLEAEIMKKSSVSLSVAKSINVPPNRGCVVELLLQPLVSHHEIAHDVLVVGISLVGSHPASHSNLKLSIIYQIFDNLLLWVVLPCIPHVKEFHFNVSKVSILIKQQLLNRLTQNQLDSFLLAIRVTTQPSIVLLKSLNPPHIIMRMRDHMHSELLVLVPPITDLPNFLPFDEGLLILLDLLLLLILRLSLLSHWLLEPILVYSPDLVTREIHKTVHPHVLEGC